MEVTSHSRSLIPACMVCKGEREAMADCRYCIGTGVLKTVGWADTPWSEIVPNLWVGGHDYAPDIWGYPLQVGSEELAEAGFDVVVSLYQRDCHPPEHVHHYMMRVADDILLGLDSDETAEVWRLAKVVGQYVTEGKKVLVRCQAGLNRSSLVAALALVRMGHEPQATIDLIREKRVPFALFNQRFVEIILASQASKESPDV